MFVSHTAHMGLPSTLHDTSLPALECVIADTTSTSTEHKAPVDSIRGLTGPMRWEWKPGLFEDMVPIHSTRWRTRPDCVYQSPNLRTGFWISANRFAYRERFGVDWY